MTLTAPAPTTIPETRQRTQLVALPPLRLEHPRLTVAGDDDARYWLTARAAIVLHGVEAVSLVPGLDELVRWDDDVEQWVRL